MPIIPRSIGCLWADLLTILFQKFLDMGVIRRLRNHRYDPRRPTLMRLPDDILLEILDIIGRPLGADQHAHSRVKIPFNLFQDRDSLIALSSVNSRLRSLAAFLLFNSIRATPHAQRLESLARSKHAQRNLRRLRFGPQYHNDTPMPEQVAPILETILCNTTDSLTMLEIDFPACNQGSHYCKLFSAALRLPAVEHLRVGPESIWIIDRCPNVRSLGSTPDHSAWPRHETRFQSHWRDLIKSASRCRRLIHFEFEIDWRSEILRAILQFLPDIESLGLPSERWRETLHAMLPTLAHFRKLRTLCLPSNFVTSTIKPLGRCGNGYTEMSEASRLSLEASRLYQLHALAVELFSEQHSISSVWFTGHDHAVVERDPGGGPLSIRWEHGSYTGCCAYWRPSRTVAAIAEGSAVGGAMLQEDHSDQEY